MNLFKQDPNFEQTEAEWDELKKEILGEQADALAGEGGLQADDDESSSEIDSEEEKEVNRQQIYDFSEKDLVNLRRTIYLVIMSSLDFEDCCHKLLKLQIRSG